MSWQASVGEPGPRSAGSGPPPTPTAGEARPWRTSAELRPRALPTDTAVRFLLVLGAVVAASLYLFDALWFVLRGNVFLDVVRACGIDAGSLAGGSVSDASVVFQEQTDCRAGVSREQSAFALTGTAAVLGIAYVAYRLLPRWRERRAHLTPLDPQDGAGLLREVRALAEEAGLQRMPVVLVDAANPAVQGFVFGTSRRPRLALTGGLVVLHITDPAAFRAVLRHELAHLANRDVPWTYYTMTVWWVFVTVALVPVVAVLAVSDLTYVLRLGWRTVLLAALVLLARNSLLRARERYADARAAEWGPRDDLDRILGAQPASPGRQRHLLRRHPPAEERRALLADPDGLFRAGAFVAFAAGVAAGTAFESVESILTLLLPSWAGPVLAAVLVAPLLALVLCVAAWRTGLRSVARGESGPAAGPMALGAGLGLALGPLLAFEAAAGGLILGRSGALGYVVWAVGTAAVVGLVTRYAVDTGRTAVEAGLREPSPRTVLAAHAVAVGAALAAVLAVGQVAMQFLTTGGPVDALRAWPVWVYLVSALGPGSSALPVIAVVVLLVLAPLLSRFVLSRGPGATVTSAAWAWRSTGSPPLVPPTTSPRLGPVLLSGALVGALAALWHLVARQVGVALVDDGVRGSDAYALALGLGSTLLLAFAVAIAAGVAAALVPRRWWPLGLLGAAAALTVGGTLVLALNVAAGCGRLPGSRGIDCSPPQLAEVDLILLQPAGVAVIGAFVLAGLVGAARASAEARTRGRRGEDDRVAGRHRWREGLVLATGATVISCAGLVLVNSVVGTEVPQADGPGYRVGLPTTWLSAGEIGDVPLLVTIDQRIRVQILPVARTAPAVGPATVEVGGETAWFVGQQVDGPITLRAFHLAAPSGAYELQVIGTPAAIAETWEDEIDDLLDGVVWNEGGSGVP